MSFLSGSLLCGARRPAICRGAVKNVAKTTLPKWRQTLLHGHGHGQWGLEGVVHAMKKSRVWRLRFCNCHFFGSRDFWKVKRMGLEIFSCHHGLAHHFLMDQSAASNTLFAFLGLWRSVLWSAFSAAGTSLFEKTPVVGHARMQFSACMAPNK